MLFPGGVYFPIELLGAVEIDPERQARYVAICDQYRQDRTTTLLKEEEELAFKEWQAMQHARDFVERHLIPA